MTLAIAKGRDKALLRWGEERLGREGVKKAGLD